MTKSLSILIFLLLGVSMSAQTYYYERIKTVSNGQASSDSGDGHFITFTEKGCYDSDKEGFSEDTGFRKYEGASNNILSYYGDSYYGKAHYYFSDDKSRLNIIPDSRDEVYVYVQRPIHPNTKSTRSRNKGTPSSASNGLVAPPIIIVAPPVNSGGSSNQSNRRQCTACQGTGHGWDEIVYAPNYTGEDNSRYCRQCGRVLHAHTHIEHRCSVCNGKGYIDY